jgi:hypothetical protein
MLWETAPFLYFNVLISFFIPGQYAPSFLSWDSYSSLTLWCSLAPCAPLFPFQLYLLTLGSSGFVFCFREFDGNMGTTIFTCFCLFYWNLRSGFSMLSSASTWCPALFILSWLIYYCCLEIGSSSIWWAQQNRFLKTEKELSLKCHFYYFISILTLLYKKPTWWIMSI